MLPSKKIRWKIPILILIVIFLSLSFYRYNQVNASFENYTVIEKVQQPGESFSRSGLTYTFGKPSFKEEAEYIYYEVPLTLQNESDEVKQIAYDRFHIRSNGVNNMLNRELFLALSVNENRTRGGVQPNSSEEVVLIFTMQKEWGVGIDTKADLYLLEPDDETMIKHKLSLNY
jgi:hypothetical protein